MMRLIRIVLYLLLIVGFGGLGCWISLVQYGLAPSQGLYSACIGNVATFSISVAILAFADHILLSGRIPAPTRALLLYLITLATLSASVVSMVLNHPIVLKTALGAAAGALLSWLLVNCKNPSFDDIDPVSALGGKVK